jgi:hypothetical protein
MQLPADHVVVCEQRPQFPVRVPLLACGEVVLGPDPQTVETCGRGHLDAKEQVLGGDRLDRQGQALRGVTSHAG